MAVRPLVSVATITYNHRRYIAQAIESVLAQRCDFPIEHVISDDCSTDGTGEIVARYQAAHPELIRRVDPPRNVGMHENACRVIAACQGQYIAFLEGDDWWHSPEKLALQVAYLEAHPECGLVYSEVRYLNDATGVFGNSPWARDGRMPEGWVYPDLLVRNFIATCSVVCRTELIRAHVDFDAHLTRAYPMGDYPMWLSLARHTQFGYIDQPLASYRVLLESAAHSADPAKTHRFWVSTCRVRLEICRQEAVSPSLRRAVGEQIFKEARDWFIFPYWQDGNYRWARHVLLSTLWMCGELVRRKDVRKLAMITLLGGRGWRIWRGFKSRFASGPS